MRAALHRDDGKRVPVEVAVVGEENRRVEPRDVGHLQREALARHHGSRVARLEGQREHTRDLRGAIGRDDLDLVGPRRRPRREAGEPAAVEGEPVGQGRAVRESRREAERIPVGVRKAVELRRHAEGDAGRERSAGIVRRAIGERREKHRPVVDRSHCEHEVVGDRLLPIRDEDPERHVAEEVLRRRARQDPRRRVEGQPVGQRRAVLAQDRIAQCVAVHVDPEPRERDREGLVLRRDPVRIGLREAGRVVHRVDHEVEDPGRGLETIARRQFQPDAAMEVLRRGAGDRQRLGVKQDPGRQRRAARPRERHCHRIAVGFAHEVLGERQREGRVLVRMLRRDLADLGGAVRLLQVDPEDRRGNERAVGDGDRDLDGARQDRMAFDHDVAGRVEMRGEAVAALHRHDRQRIAIGVGVVRKREGSRDGDGGGRAGCKGVVRRAGGIGDGRKRQHQRPLGHRNAVIRHQHKIDRTREIRRGHARKRARLGVEGEPRRQAGPIRRSDRKRQRVAVGVSDRTQRDHRLERGVLHPLEGELIDFRSIVHRGEVDANLTVVAKPREILDPVADPHLAVEVGRGRHREVAECILRDRDLGRHGKTCEEERVTVGVPVIAEDARERNEERLVLGSGEEVVPRLRGVGQRGHVNPERAVDGQPVAVVDPVGQLQFAENVLGGGVEPSTIRLLGRSVEPEEAQRVAVGVIVVGEEHGRIDHQRAVFLHAQGVTRRDGKVVRRQDADRDVAPAHRAMHVGHAVAEARVAEIVGARREHDLSVHQFHGAVVAIEDLDQLQCVALGVAVIGDEVSDGEDQRHVLVDHEGPVGVRHRRVVHRREVHRHGPGAGQAPVADPVDEGHRPVDVLVRHELQIAARKLVHPAALAGPGGEEGDRVLRVGVPVVEEKIGLGDHEGRILDALIEVRAGDRGDVGRCHVDRDGGARRAGDAVVDRVGEGHLAVEVGVRGEDGLVAIEHDRAVARRTHRNHRQCIAVGVGVVGEERRDRDS